SAQIREILISESAWEEMTCLFAPSLGLRVYEAQMERKESGFNQMAFNKVLLETVLKTQFATNKILGISCLSPHISGNQKFEWRFMIDTILEDTKEVVDTFFPESEDGEEE
ncbi:conjugal transfer relaxosome DNA-binding protein TraM, partial [Klebsiella pneumoniae]|uniref:conjugal transfer relaxosome DNA-binding protein TraM n=1 Tax=Klebsiella pneumoniae TaxID=573 RepID=UPI000AD27852